MLSFLLYSDPFRLDTTNPRPAVTPALPSVLPSRPTAMSSLLSSLARVARGVVGTAAVGYLSAIFIADNVCHLTRLRGPSMLPTFEPGDRVLCVVPGARDIKLGDIVIAKNPDTLDTLMCKRVVAIVRLAFALYALVSVAFLSSTSLQSLSTPLICTDALYRIAP